MGFDPRRSQARPCGARFLGAVASVPVAAAAASPVQTMEPAVEAAGEVVGSDATNLVRGSPGVPIEEEHVAQMCELVGQLPDDLLRRGLLTSGIVQKLEEVAPPPT